MGERLCLIQVEGSFCSLCTYMSAVTHSFVRGIKRNRIYWNRSIRISNGCKLYTQYWSPDVFCKKKALMFINRLRDDEIKLECKLILLFFPFKCEEFLKCLFNRYNVCLFFADNSCNKYGVHANECSAIFLHGLVSDRLLSLLDFITVKSGIKSSEGRGREGGRGLIK